MTEFKELVNPEAKTVCRLNPQCLLLKNRKLFLFRELRYYST